VPLFNFWIWNPESEVSQDRDREKERRGSKNSGIMTDIKDILIIKMSALGGIVMATPVVDHLKAFTGARITWVTDQGMAPLLEGHPDIDELLLFPRNSFRSLKEDFFYSRPVVRMLWQKLKTRRFDLAIDLQGLGRSYLVLQSARAGEKIGRGRFPFLKKTILHNRNIRRHAVEVNLDVLKILDIPQPSKPELYLPVQKERRQNVLQILGEHAVKGTSVVFLPASTWPSKNWPYQYWSSLASWFLNEGFHVIMTGSDRERKIGERIRSSIPHREKVLNLFGKFSLNELNALFEYPELIIGCDSGPLHIASATQTPLLGLYGPTDPERTGPWPRDRATILQAQECRICRRRRCRSRCMKNLLPETVIEAVEKMLQD
jgi:lipopolysaccharide heptosyltransferase I